MNLSTASISFMAIIVGFSSSLMANEFKSSCDAYPYPKGIFMTVIDNTTTYIYTVNERQEDSIGDSHLFIKLRASRIARQNLGKYIYLKYKNKLDFSERKVSGIFHVSECINHSGKNYYTSYAWSEISYRISQAIK